MGDFAFDAGSLASRRMEHDEANAIVIGDMEVLIRFLNRYSHFDRDSMTLDMFGNGRGGEGVRLGSERARQGPLLA